MNTTKIVFLVLPRTHLLDLAGPIQVFQEAIEQGAQLEILYCSHESALTTSSDFPFGKLPHYTEIQFRTGDFLMVAGAEVSYIISKQLTANKELLKWVGVLHASGVRIASICTGAFFLGAAGLLNERKCTTHWKRTAELKKRFPRIQLVEDILFTECDGIYTSAGVTAGIDLALFILEQLTDDHLAYKVARELVVYVRRSGADSQESSFMKYRNHIHSGIHQVQDYLHDNLQTRVSLSQLADKACMSPRNLTRIFKRETGITVNEYTSILRREVLKKLSGNPDISRKQMARHCGLTSERQVIRLLKSS